MKIKGADFVVYLVSDLKKAAAFYRDVLELPQTEYKKDWDWAEFDCGNITLTLFSGAVLPEIVLGGRIALAVDDIHAAHEELKEKGVDVVKPPYELSGCWMLEILDPDRNMVFIHKRKDESVGQEQVTD
jgi:predicted enzyme related to lactoylglutathione lyase